MPECAGRLGVSSGVGSPCNVYPDLIGTVAGNGHNKVTDLMAYSLFIEVCHLAGTNRNGTMCKTVVVVVVVAAVVVVVVVVVVII